MDDWIRAVRAAIAFLVVTCAIAALLGGCAKADATERLGCPLDAVRYKAPVFADPDHPAWRVSDRSAHVGWWLVWVDGGYVALPVGKELNGDE